MPQTTKSPSCKTEAEKRKEAKLAKRRYRILRWMRVDQGDNK
jgi:hypothetical protein